MKDLVLPTSPGLGVLHATRIAGILVCVAVAIQNGLDGHIALLKKSNRNAHNAHTGNVLTSQARTCGLFFVRVWFRFVHQGN